MYKCKPELTKINMLRSRNKSYEFYTNNDELVMESMQLANFLAAKSKEELSEIADSNPELIEEWLGELKQTIDEAHFITIKLRESFHHVLSAARPGTRKAAE